jgi:hypothetical protein
MIAEERASGFRLSASGSVEVKQRKPGCVLRAVISLTRMEFDPKWILHLHSAEAWLALAVGAVEVLVHEPSVRWILTVMLLLGMAFALFFRLSRKSPDGDFSVLHLTPAPHASRLSASGRLELNA